MSLESFVSEEANQDSEAGFTHPRLPLTHCPSATKGLDEQAEGHYSAGCRSDILQESGWGGRIGRFATHGADGQACPSLHMAFSPAS